MNGAQGSAFAGGGVARLRTFGGGTQRGGERASSPKDGTPAADGRVLKGRTRPSRCCCGGGGRRQKSRRNCQQRHVSEECYSCDRPTATGTRSCAAVATTASTAVVASLHSSSEEYRDSIPTTRSERLNTGRWLAAARTSYRREEKLKKTKTCVRIVEPPTVAATVPARRNFANPAEWNAVAGRPSGKNE